MEDLDWIPTSTKNVGESISETAHSPAIHFSPILSTVFTNVV